MVNNILLTPELKTAMPETIKALANFGETQVVFPPAEGETEWLDMVGDNAVLEGSTEDFIKWLKPFDGFAVGVGGSPQFEQFEIRHIAENL